MQIVVPFMILFKLCVIFEQNDCDKRLITRCAMEVNGKWQQHCVFGVTKSDVVVWL